MYELIVFTYGSGPSMRETKRFDGLIAEALVSQANGKVRVTWHEDKNAIHGTGVFMLDGMECTGLLGDCFILVNEETRAFKVVDFQDCDHGPAFQLQASPKWRGAVLSMFHRATVEKLYGENAHLVLPGWFLDQHPELTRESREIVDQIRCGPLDDRLHFRGTVSMHRASVQMYEYLGSPRRLAATVLEQKYPDEVVISDEKYARPDWFATAAHHRINLALPGAFWCYREFELLNLGLPFITYPWHTHIECGDIAAPFAHYISTGDLPRYPPGHAIDAEQAADLIIAAHRKALQRPEWTEAVGRRARRWYDAHLSPEQIAGNLLSLLALGEGDF